METKSRRAHGIRSRKISVSVSAEDLKVLSSRARRLHGGNLSAVVHEMAATLRRQEAAEDVLAMLGGERVTEAEMQAVRDEIAGASRPARRKKTRAA